MRATRVIYVENDPALRSIMAGLLDQRPDIELLLSTGSAAEALSGDAAGRSDAALIDLALGSTQMNGIDLGLALRELNENIGIVIHSQYRLDSIARRVPDAARIGWMALPKTGGMTIDDVVDTLRAAAQGFSRLPNIEPGATSPLEAMSVRQRAVMGMVAAGVKTHEIARRLGTTHDSVRQDLTRAYRLLVPDAEESDELRTRAILAYLGWTRDDDADDGS